MVSLVDALKGDAAFPQTEAMLDAVVASAALSKAIGCAVNVTAVRVMRHRLGRRVVLRYETEAGWAIAGKVRAKGTDERTHRLQSRLHALGWREGGEVGAEVPMPLGIVPGWSMTLQTWLGGTPASAWFDPPGRDGAPEVAERLGVLLARLHDADVGVTRRHDAVAELRVLRGQLGLLAAAFPSESMRIEGVIARAERVADAVFGAGVAAATLHRDFHPEQVLVAEDRWVLLDLDTVAVGPRAIDVGNMAAHWLEAALRGGDETRHAVAVARFTAAYEAAGVQLAEGAVVGATALSLLRLAGVALRIEERRPWASATFALGERWLARAGARAA
jgi:aminoglycoside phosphotransferase (APT) family kinase protein